VAATLVHRVLGDRLHCVFVDHGLLRYKVSRVWGAEGLRAYGAVARVSMWGLWDLTLPHLII
jgi:hypothetical protein